MVSEAVLSTYFLQRVGHKSFQGQALIDLQHPHTHSSLYEKVGIYVQYMHG